MLIKKYYPQILLEECKYALKKKKIINAINNELKLDESDDESDNDKSNESVDINLLSLMKIKIML